MLKHDYTTAVLALLDEGKTFEAVLQGLTLQLTRKGHSALLPSILKELERRITQKEHTSIPQVKVARESDVNTQKSQIESLLASLSSTKGHTTTVDESLIGGVVVEHNNRIIDASYKKQLLALYRALTI